MSPRDNVPIERQQLLFFLFCTLGRHIDNQGREQMYKRFRIQKRKTHFLFFIAKRENLFVFFIEQRKKSFLLKNIKRLFYFLLQNVKNFF